MQDTLRHLLYERLTGENVDEVRPVFTHVHHDTEGKYQHSFGNFSLQIIKRVRQSLSYIGELEPPVRVKVIASYEDALHVTMYFTASLTVLAIVSSVFIKEKPLTK